MFRGQGAWRVMWIKRGNTICSKFICKLDETKRNRSRIKFYKKNVKAIRLSKVGSGIFM